MINNPSAGLLLTLRRCTHLFRKRNLMTNFDEHYYPTQSPVDRFQVEPRMATASVDPYGHSGHGAAEPDYVIDADKPDMIKVSAKSRSTSVAGAIAAVIREHRYAEVQAIGAGAVNQAVKALAIARGYLQQDGIDILCMPYFTEVMIDEQERTAVRFVVEPRKV